MKLSTRTSILIATYIAACTTTTIEAFVPTSRSFVANTGTGTGTTAVTPVTTDASIGSSSTALNLFGCKGRKIAKAAKVAKDGSGITNTEVRALFNLWNDALATGDSRIVARRYTESCSLLPTVSDVPRTDYDSVKDYFDAFLKKQPQGEIIEGFIKIGDNGDWASDTGIYEFTMGVDGSKVRGRYSYLYVQENGVWKIQHHHSSVMPEEIAMGKAITEDEVKGLFSLWNDALASLDSKKVAARYAKAGVLLPTVSDTPRTDFEGINDYFTNFLKLKPQGEILESNVMIGHNWCQDAGIYEFTMGASGAKVKGRYSFVYVYEDGEWKIAHHHSSVMPEGIVTAQPITETEVRSLFGRWNDALASLDPKKVADRYSSKGVLLPTVSDVPRTDYPGIVDYFTNFSSSSRRVRFCLETSLLEPTGPRMLVSMNSPWAPLDRRLRDVTPMCTSMKTVTGRSVSITPVSCLRVPSPSLLLRLRSRTCSSFGTWLLQLRILTPSLCVIARAPSCYRLFLMSPELIMI